MRIAFDLRRIRNPGIGRYMKCLVKAILAEDPGGNYLLIVPPGTEGSFSKAESNGAKIVTSGLKYYSISEQIGLPRILLDNNVDLLHAPHFVLPLFRPCASVVTLHDVIGLAWKEDLGSPIGQIYYKFMITAAVRLANRIITDSNFSRNDIVSRLGADPKKINVIYPGISSDFRPAIDNTRLERIRKKYGIEGDFIAYTGIYKPRKNHAALLRAFRILRSRQIEAKLVFIGPLQEGQEHLRHMAAELGISERVIFAGFVEDIELQTLYAAAKVYACPSLYEGFGFTVLEAMACGTPVVCSRETSLPEVTGEAALYANPKNSEEFADALHQAFTNTELRAGLIEKGIKNVQRFRWENAARETLEVYRDAAKVALQCKGC